MRRSLAQGIASFLLPTLFVAAGCSAPGTGHEEDVSTPSAKASCTPVAELEIVVTDAWGRPVKGAALLHSQADPCAAGGDVPCVRLPAGSTWLAVTAPGYQPAALKVERSDDGCLAAVTPLHPGAPAIPAPPRFPAPSVVPMPAEVFLPPPGADDRPVLFMALSHEWFADSGSPPARNRAEYFLSGEEFYASLAVDLREAQQTIHAATWWWQSNFELVRTPDQPFLSEEERWDNTAMAILLARPHVFKRVNVGRFTGETAAGMAYVNTDSMLRSRALDPTDNFEVMIQGNPTPVPLNDPYVPMEHPLPYASRLLRSHPELDGWTLLGTQTDLAALTTIEAASWHQKVWTIDGRIAYVSGMNVKSSDWDTEDHAVFEARRMKYKSPPEDRQAVVDRLAFPDLGPRKDAGIRLEGPAAHAVDSILAARWEWGRGGDALFGEYATPFPLLEMPPDHPDGILSQVVATMPEPFGERSILESHRKAIRNALSLIFIEDQYFRIPMLLPELAEGLAAHPALRIVVVTKPVSLADGARKWTVEMDRSLRELAGDRYLLLQGRVADMEGTADGESGPVFSDMDVHTKLVFVDDHFLTVGSANKNNRGMLYEGEMNAVVLDTQFVAQVRARHFANLTGDEQFPWATASGAEILDRMKQLAETNQQVRDAVEAHLPPPGPPIGFLHPLAFTPEYLIDCGPDAF
ncbi:MAG: hypothetical protein FJ109_17220 [Deltaproteobacteria bacterium]|nr:hypothetical protein [Deltaproteobacteria bacterium]